MCQGEHRLILSHSLPIADEVDSVEATLVYDNVLLATARVPISHRNALVNPHWETVISLISQTRKWTSGSKSPEDALAQWLGPVGRKTEGDNFERAVATLLFGTGLPSLWMGGVEGVDQVVVVQGPFPTVVLISCTADADIGSKITGLLTQRNRLAELQNQWHIRMGIFAPVDRFDLRIRDEEDAQHHSIRLFLRPDLEVLFELIKAGWLDEARSHLVPGTSFPTV